MVVDIVLIACVYVLAMWNTIAVIATWRDPYRPLSVLHTVAAVTCYAGATLLTVALVRG